MYVYWKFVVCTVWSKCWFFVQVVQDLPLSQVPVHVAGGVSGWWAMDNPAWPVSNTRLTSFKFTQKNNTLIIQYKLQTFNIRTCTDWNTCPRLPMLYKSFKMFYSLQLTASSTAFSKGEGTWDNDAVSSTWALFTFLQLLSLSLSLSFSAAVVSMTPLRDSVRPVWSRHSSTYTQGKLFTEISRWVVIATTHHMTPSIDTIHILYCLHNMFPCRL